MVDVVYCSSFRRSFVGLILVTMVHFAAAEVEIRAEERQRFVEQVATMVTTLQRVVVADQKLIVWIPEGFTELERNTRYRTYRHEEWQASIGVSRYPAEPGLGLFHAWELLERKLREDGVLIGVDSVRQIEVAGRAALEVVAQTKPEEVVVNSRLVMTMDDDEKFSRLIGVHWRGEDPSRGEQLLKVVLRDYTPVDGGIWGSKFEVLRQQLVGGGEEQDWQDRNRVFAAVTDPAAIGQPWVDAQLEALGLDHPVMLLDGLLHPHPRIRVACLEGLALSSMEPGRRRRMLALSLRDADPVVRFTAAEAVQTGEEADARWVLDRALSVDQETSRQGSLQLLALMDAGLRQEVLHQLIVDRDFYPSKAQSLIACALGEWGGEEDIGVLARAYRRAVDPGFKAAALSELLKSGHEVGLAHARRRLADPAQEDPLSVAEAVDHLMRESEADDDLQALRKLADGLDEAAEDADEHLDWTAGAEGLRLLAEHFESLPAEVTEAGQCKIVAELLAEDRDLRWASQRSAALGCDLDRGPEIQSPTLSVEVAHPGSLLLSLRNLLDRLQLSDEDHHQLYHRMIGFMFDSIDDDFPDPLTENSSGLDLATPWLLQGAVPGAGTIASNADDLELAPTVECTDPERFVRLLVRSASAGNPLHDALPAFFLASVSLPFVPAMLAMIWDEEHTTALGEDDDPPEDPTETYRILTRTELDGGAIVWRYRQLEVFRQELAAWSTVFSARVDGQQVTLSPPESSALTFSQPVVAPAEDTASVVLNLDLAAMKAEVDDDDLVHEVIGDESRLVTTFDFDGNELSTTIDVDGLIAEWRRVLKPVEPKTLLAPAAVLPDDTVFWTGLSIDVPALAALVISDPERWLSELDDLGDLGEVDPAALLDLVAGMGSEVGLAVIGVPSLDDQHDSPWLERVVFFLAVSDSNGQIFLDRVFGPGEEQAASGIHSKDGFAGAVVNGYLILAQNPEVVAEVVELEGRARLVTTEFHESVVARSPEQAVMVAVLNVDEFAGSLAGMVEGHHDSAMTLMGIEFFRSFGSIVFWGDRSDVGLHGRVSLRPALADEQAMEKVRRLIGLTGYTSGSIPVDGFYSGFSEADIVELELELLLDEPGVTLADVGGERVDRTVMSPKSLRLLSRSGVGLPEASDLKLPIEGEELAPFLRAEPGLGLREKDVADLAEEIRAGEKDPAKIVRAILEWVQQNLEYTSIDGTESVAEILASREADCTEFAHLTVALCRSLGIPARSVGGASVGRQVAILHRWTEVYLDRWYEIDPTSGSIRIPASSMPLPSTAAYALATGPGNRLVLKAVRAQDGGLARRLPVRVGLDGDGDASSEQVLIAVDGDIVVIADGGGDEDQPLDRLVLSRDRGVTFEELLGPVGGSELMSLVAGHGRVLGVAQDDGGSFQLLQLTESGSWRPVDLPEQLTRLASTQVAMNSVDDGFLVILGGDQARTMMLSPNLELTLDQAVPELGSAWALAKDQALVAVSNGAAGVSLRRWEEGRWKAVAIFSDADGLVPLQVRTTKTNVEVLCRDTKRNRDTLLWWSPQSGEEGRAAPSFSIIPEDSVTSGGWSWSVWRDREDLIFSRRPL